MPQQDSEYLIPDCRLIAECHRVIGASSTSFARVFVRKSVVFPGLEPIRFQFGNQLTSTGG